MITVFALVLSLVFVPLFIIYTGILFYEIVQNVIEGRAETKKNVELASKPAKAFKTIEVGDWNYTHVPYGWMDRDTKQNETHA